jgi:hypothetical protein
MKFRLTVHCALSIIHFSSVAALRLGALPVAYPTLTGGAITDRRIRACTRQFGPSLFSKQFFKDHQRGKSLKQFSPLMRVTLNFDELFPVGTHPSSARTETWDGKPALNRKLSRTEESGERRPTNHHGNNESTRRIFRFKSPQTGESASVSGRNSARFGI